MNDEQKTPEDHHPNDERATVEQPAPPSAAPATDVPIGDTRPKVFTTPRTRNILLTSGAGLALAGGVLGFGIGHATAGGDDGGRDDRMSRFAPAHGRPDLGERDHHGGQRGERRGPGAEPGRQPPGDDDPA